MTTGIKSWVCYGLLALLVSSWLVPFAAAQRRGGGGGIGSGGGGRPPAGERDRMMPGTVVMPEAAASVGTGTVPAFDAIPGDPPLDVSLAWGTSIPAVPAKVVRYATIVFEHYDYNGDGVWQQNEWELIPGAPQAADIDGDLEVTLEELVHAFVTYGHGRTIHRPLRPELVQHTASVRPTGERRLFHPVTVPAAASSIVPPASSQVAVANTVELAADTIDSDMTDVAVTAAMGLSPEEVIAAEQQIPAERRYHTHHEELVGVPAWFLLRDKNGDGQISIVEFAPQLSAPALALFGQLDQDGNGLVSPQEAKPRSRPHP